MNALDGREEGRHIRNEEHLVRRPHERETPTVWSYPLLCLAWHLGWGGHRLMIGDEPAGSNAMLQTLGRGIESPAAGTPDASADREPAVAPIASTANATDDADAPEGMPATLDRLMALLDRSPLAELITASDRAAIVIRDTARLICPEPPVGYDIAVPPFWRLALATWPGRHESRWVPRPRPRWDPATWTLVGVLEAAWEATGTTFLGRERPALFQVVGTRRMAARHGWSLRRTLACGRTAHRIWRHWFEQTEQKRLDRVRTWPVAGRVAVTLGDPILAYRITRAAVRTGRETPDLEALPGTLRALFHSLASASVAELRPPVATDRPPEFRTRVARALVVTPLGLAAARRGLSKSALWAAANETAARLLWLLTAPWPWTPRPVVRGPRRARQEARRRAAAARR
jgi:hypothetical protein